MARLIIGESHIMWFALKGSASYAMRSDRALLLREEPAAGQRKAAHVGWQVAERKVMDFTKLRLDLVARGFTITREVKVNENSFQLEAKGSESLCNSNSQPQPTKNGEAKMDIKSLTTKQLVDEYNKATGKDIKKFASRAKGEAQLAKALTAKPQSAAARQVHGSAGAAPQGRPKKDYTVILQPSGTTKITSVSSRRKILDFIEKNGGKSTIGGLRGEFGELIDGTVRELIKRKWLSVKE